MSKALKKELIVSIKRSFTRFLSLVAIVTLGTGFFVGISSVAPDMKHTADTYFNTNNLMDLRVISTLGLTDADAARISKLKGVSAVMPAHSIDTLLEIDGKKKLALDGSVFSCRIIGFDIEDAKAFQSGKNDISYMNRLSLLDGRMPNNDTECVVDGDALTKPKEFKVGQKIKLVGDNENITSKIKKTELTIVGLVRTPLFTSAEKGSTLIGSGRLGTFIFVTDELFIQDFYTEIYVKTANADKHSSYSEKYKNTVDPVIKALNGISETVISERRDILQPQLAMAINEGRTELSTKEAEIEIQLADAKDKVEQMKYYAAHGDEEMALKKADAERQLKDAQSRFDSGKTKYTNGLNEYNSKLAEFNAAGALVAEHPNARKEYNDAKNMLSAAERTIKTSENVIKVSETVLQLLNGYLNTPEGEDLYYQILSELYNMGFAGIENMSRESVQAKLAQTSLELNDAKDRLEIAKQEYEVNKQKLKEAEPFIAKLNEYDAAYIKLQKAQKELDAAHEDLETAELKLNLAKTQFESEVKQAELQIEAAKALYKTAETEYETKREEAYAKIENAKYDLAEAEEIYANLGSASLILSERKDLAGYEDYRSTTDNIAALAKVFPIFFFLVATLISLNTMTRMVEEERGQMGTLKALGYSERSIAAKYIIYASAASLIGIILGFAIGFTTLPYAMANSYSILFILPPVKLRFYILYASIAAAASLLATVGAALFVCRGELAGLPAKLMRPKAPKPGRRVFLERITFIWSRLSFTSKVTIRNLFRNKRRFIMTVFGIAGCTALILTGFGLGNSIKAILHNQFGDNGIMAFDLQVVFSDPKKAAGDETPATEKLRADVNFDKTMLCYMKTVSGTSKANGAESFEVNIVVPESESSLNSFVKLQTRRGKNKLNLTDSGVLVNEKFTNALGLKVGDFIKLNDGKKTVELKIAGITENYAYNYVYISRAVYQEKFGEIEYNGALCNLSAANLKLSEKELNEKKNAISEDYMKTKGVIAIVYNTNIVSSLKGTLDKLNNIIVSVFTVAAGALALVVLYNLNNINIGERTRDLATIKLLGFYDKEASAYIYRENIILTLLGIIIGLLMGIPIHRYAIMTAEVNMVMFGRDIKLTSYLLSAGIAALFAFLVNLSMHYRIKKISMVDSLKSVE